MARRLRMVAGYLPTRAGYSTALWRWNGRTWTPAKLAAAPEGVTNGALATVSCGSPTSCLAIGDGTSAVGKVAVAEVWNGKAWSLTRPIVWPKHATTPEATAVSCPTARYCVLVGNVDSNPSVSNVTGRAAASIWNGKTWTATSVAAPGKGGTSFLSGVTCLRPSFCVAVGKVGPSDSDSFWTRGIGLTEFWNGRSWRQVSLR